MKELRSGANSLEVQVSFSSHELKFVLGIMQGNGISHDAGKVSSKPIPWRESISRKMVNYGGLEDSLNCVDRLPFMYRDGQSRREGEVTVLSLAGYGDLEMSRVLGVNRRVITKYKERAERKRLLNKDKNVPELHLKEGQSDTIDLVKAMHFVIASGKNRYKSNVRPQARLSVNESTTLLWLCTGRTDMEIASAMGVAYSDVRMYLKRASEKLGVSKRMALIAATLSEVMRQGSLHK